MILKREEKDNKIEALYLSSNILSSIYDKNNNTLIITFKNGGEYLYENVPNTNYLKFETADSQGVVFTTNIKRYPFRKLGNVNVNELLTEIEQLKEKK